MSITQDERLSGNVLSQRVSEIIRLESEADYHAEEYEACKWGSAELIALELADGKTQRQLASEIGKSHSHVGRMARSWNLKVPSDTRSFNEVYNSPEVRGGTTKPEIDSGPKGSPTPTPVPTPRPVPMPIPPHDINAETDEWRKSQPENSPLPELSMTPAQAWGEWKSTLSRIISDVASLPSSADEREIRRQELHEMIDRSFK